MADDFENFQGMHTTISIVPTSSASDAAPQMTRPLISVKDFRIPSASPGGVVSSSTSSPPGSACMRPPPPPGPPRPSRNVGYVEVKQERLDRERHPHEEPSSSIPDLGKSLPSSLSLEPLRSGTCRRCEPSGPGTARLRFGDAARMCDYVTSVLSWATSVVVIRLSSPPAVGAVRRCVRNAPARLPPNKYSTSV
ncbi:UNVERIFIED_CONTAM: hypothetical protein PYX00_005222 [Menopon gallinae]|uniref:Uncharacterized protein n=1 Tax=Menopon gallinae TaxID=328185 RepID=A0AAW2HRP6_9NEOP